MCIIFLEKGKTRISMIPKKLGISGQCFPLKYRWIIKRDSRYEIVRGRKCVWTMREHLGYWKWLHETARKSQSLKLKNTISQEKGKKKPGFHHPFGHSYTEFEMNDVRKKNHPCYLWNWGCNNTRVYFWRNFGGNYWSPHPRGKRFLLPCVATVQIRQWYTKRKHQIWDKSHFAILWKIWQRLLVGKIAGSLRNKPL